MMKTMVIDDHKEMRSNLCGMLQAFDNIRIVGEASGVQEGLQRITALKPELIFLDVEMGDGTGFDLLSQLENKSMKVIFVTGHDTYAIKAFKFSAIDYLLKPVDPDDLEQAIEKAFTSAFGGSSEHIETLLHNRETLKRLVLSDAQSTYLIDLKEIVRIASDVNYSKFYLQDGREIVMAKTLKTYHEMLGNSGFFRSHQSHLVNLAHFERLDKADGGTIRMRTGDSVPVSSRKRDELMLALEAFATN